MIEKIRGIATIKGNCPHCGAPTQCGILDNKLAVECDSCGKHTFDSIRGLLKSVSLMFIVPIIPAVVGMGLRTSVSMNVFLLLVAFGAALLFGVLFLERYFCQKALRHKD